MIVPLKKVFLVAQDKYRDESLKLLRTIGVLHLEKKMVSSEALSKLLEIKTKCENVLRILRPYEKADKKSESMDNVLKDSINTADEIIKNTLLLADEKKTILDTISRLRRERSRLEELGDFNPKDFPFITENGGINLFLYKLTRKAFDEISPETRYIQLSGNKDFVRILVFDKELSGRTQFALSDFSCSEIDSQISDLDDQLFDIEQQLLYISGYQTIIEDEIEIILSKIEFETAKAKMDIPQDIPAESAISWISGFVPQEDLGFLKRGASENGWALLADDPGTDDIVPTKLKHNRAVKLLKPLTDFLGVTPGYDEPDIAPWFLFFFTIFFGMIFGDAVYGALFVIAAIIIMLKNRKKGVHVGIKLLLLLGTSNLIWGILTCTWFGLEVKDIPLVLQQISLPLISNVTAVQSPYHEGIVRQNLMIFCFTLALLHLCIGHIVAITRIRTLKIMAEFGSIGMLVGMYGIILSLIASNEYRQIPMSMIFVYALGIGFVISFIFTYYEGSIGRSILEAFKNFIAMVLGITNVFSDIMSYIRLWAVGLAGAAISSTVVSLAGPMLGHFIFFIFGIILLAFGHGLNLVLNALSVLVHGVRLNTLEFSSHAGLTWSGTEYKPFKDSI